MLEMFSIVEQFRYHCAHHGNEISKGLKFMTAVSRGPLADLLAGREVVHVADDIDPQASLISALFNRGVLTDIRLRLN
jgi:hypothetical protein